MKRNTLLALAFSLSIAMQAQDYGSSYTILRLPISAHSSALGGSSISLVEDDPTLIFENPALLGFVENKSLNLNYMTYLEGCKVASAAFTHFAGERSSWAATARYIDYGSMKEVTANNEIIGTFTAKDMVFSGLYSYQLGDHWTGGVAVKGIYSKYAEFSAFALGVDLGLHYLSDDENFSFAFTAKNLGGQLKAFDSKCERLPYDFQLGITQKMENAPLRFTVTMSDLTQWKSSYYCQPLADESNVDASSSAADAQDDGISFGKKLLNHFSVGVDVLPSSNLYLAAGYNFRRANEMKDIGGSHGAGWSFGGGIQLQRLKAGVSYGKYHLGASSLLFNVSYAL